MTIRIAVQAVLALTLGTGLALAQTQVQQDVGGWAPKPPAAGGGTAPPPAPGGGIGVAPPPPPAPGGGIAVAPPPAPGDGPKTISRGADDPAPAPGPRPSPVVQPGPSPVPPPPPVAAGPGPAPMPGNVLLANDADAIHRAMVARGYWPEMSSDDQGNPKLILSTSRSTYWILFLDCESSEGCLGVEFYVSYELNPTPPLQVLNQFNNDYRYIRAFSDVYGQPRMMMDVLMRDGGLDEETFFEYLRLWEVILPSFEDAIGF